ncbi:helix-turn-helix domain-containing protein [Clostridium hydrogeniformans]|uniref:helix-turn-helix domain-containing protein n=1 Tax=Clostridium hydrogeniformans TaxID=349933 RepID=UPI00068B8BB4|nr:helix-turn-helix domain-containing protein [Clostridium hydrogeniformans]
MENNKDPTEREIKFYKDKIEPYLEEIPKWRRNGYTTKQVAERLGISQRTLERHQKKFESLMTALKKGKEELVLELEETLYKKALGYEYWEEKEYISSDGKKKKVKKERIKKLYQSDTALIFALKNLAPHKWRDKQNIEHSGNVFNEVNITIDGEEYGD